MIGWATLLKSLASLWASIMTFFNNKELRDDGARRAELEGRKEADEIAHNIDVKRADPELRKATRKKYTRP